MALFDGTSNGDIWACGAFQDESSLKELLDKGDFTLEQLLSEDELLQELKGMHPQLVSYFASPRTCRELLRHLTVQSVPSSSSSSSWRNVTPGPGSRPHEYYDDEHLNRTIRYPFMACEIFCCEITGIIDTLADGFVVEDPEGSPWDDGEGDHSPNSHHHHHSEYNDRRTRNDESCGGDALGCMDGDTNVNVNDNDLATTSSAGTKQPKRRRMLDVLFESLGTLDDTKNTERLRNGSDNLTQTATSTVSDDYDNVQEVVIDDRLAGYLEKVVSVLLRLRPNTISSYLKTNADRLLPMLFKNISSFSIMQILQRLLLPSDDSPPDALNLNPVISNTRGSVLVDLDLTLKLILERIVSPQPTSGKVLDEASHCAEILVSLLQSSNSPLEQLLSPPNFSQIIEVLKVIPEPFTPSESKLTHVLHILEAMLLQLGGYGMHEVPTKEYKLSILPQIPIITGIIRNILTHPSTQNWKMQCQMKTETPRCGIPRLRAVRVLEALILLGEEKIDEVLLSEANGGGDVIAIACDLFFQLTWCNGLHQSVANMLVHVIEGEKKRHNVQKYLINSYKLLDKLLDAFDQNSASVDSGSFRLGYMGHIIIICQALEHVENTDKSKNDDAIMQSRSIDGDEDMNGGIETNVVDIFRGKEETLEIYENEINKLSNVDIYPSIVESTNPDEKNIDMTLEDEARDMDSILHTHEKNESTSLVNQAINTPIPTESLDELMTEDNPSHSQHNLSKSLDNERTSVMSKNNPMLTLKSFIQSSGVYSKWSAFTSGTLCEVAATQSRPLGGSTSERTNEIFGFENKNMFGGFQRNDTDILVDDPIMSGTGDGDGTLDITENELDIAASMMESLSIGKSVTYDMESTSKYNRNENGENGTKSHMMSPDYFYDDPLGSIKNEKFHNGFDHDEMRFAGFDNRDNMIESNGDDDDFDKCDSNVKILDLFVPRYKSEASNTSSDIVDMKETLDNSGKDSESQKHDGQGLGNENNQTVDESVWSNFADFESITMENGQENKLTDSFSNSNSVSVFHNHKEESNMNTTEIQDCFFDADFSNLKDCNGKEANDPIDEKITILQNGLDDQSPENFEGASFQVEGFSEPSSSNSSVGENKVIDDPIDPFGDSGIRRHSIEELF